jgi:hypothetical protein
MALEFHRVGVETLATAPRRCHTVVEPPVLNRRPNDLLQAGLPHFSGSSTVPSVEPTPTTAGGKPDIAAIVHHFLRTAASR